ncbi:hypothetical protein [Pseudoxanthomonas sp. PXM01]|uniref:hypothetical protein n=1 Tax=Pseudoxanthomonas sp. PXM01 TaxID=2769295 RepID=UPI00177CF514|nr:hypothetical protein [Pseudoxanthomonas sp. PXM01]MBD9470614.1 hypothetical protein [Pseudoxanthomonas sp. PXM01]
MASIQASTLGSAFVTVTAKVSIVIGVFAALYAAMQVIAAVLLLGHVDIDAVLGFLSAQSVPAPVVWVLTHLTTIAVAFLAICIAFLAVSVGLLRRHAWGWWGFVLFMVMGAAANFAGIAAMDAAFALVQALPHQPETEQLRTELAALRVLTLATLWATAIVFAVLHGLVVWQLCKPTVRSEFGMPRSPR